MPAGQYNGIVQRQMNDVAAPERHKRKRTRSEKFVCLCVCRVKWVEKCNPGKYHLFVRKTSIGPRASGKSEHCRAACVPSSHHASSMLHDVAVLFWLFACQSMAIWATARLPPVHEWPNAQAQRDKTVEKLRHGQSGREQHPAAMAGYHHLLNNK